MQHCIRAHHIVRAGTAADKQQREEAQYEHQENAVSLSGLDAQISTMFRKKVGRRVFCWKIPDRRPLGYEFSVAARWL
jgi:hypothetical protein